MHITEIKLQNFKPFYGEVVIHPTTEPGKPLLLVQGKNDTGKTSFHSAFRFCLYGPRDQDEKHSLINREAAVEDAGVASVTIAFEHGENIFEIERGVEYNQVQSADNRQAESTYREVRDVDGNLIVSKSDGTREYRKFINRVLPENVADFFFFDAEELNRFEESHDKEVREAIETILGIQEIENSSSDLEKKKTDYEREFTKVQSNIEKNNERKQEVNEINDRIDEIEGEDGEISHIEEEIRTKNKSLEEVNQALAEISDTSSKRDEVDELTSKIVEAEGELEGKYQDRRELQRKAGPLIAQNAAEVILNDYDVEGVSGEADVINSLLDRDTCLCGEELTPSHREKLRQRWVRLQSEETRRLADLQEVCGRLDINVDADLQKYQSHQREVVQLEENIELWEQEREELEQEIQEIEEGAEESLSNKKKQLKSEIKSCEERKSELDQKIGELRNEKDRLLERIQSQGQATEKEKEFQELINVAGRCRDAMKDIKDELVERRRNEVQEHATDTFLALTNRPDHYKGLKITENYELRVLTEGSERSIAEQKPSEGQKQIIAYAFIAGLSRYTTRNAPVVIDTPIGRLDREHKNNLLDYYHKFSGQVMILYQPNEMDEEDIQSLADRMSKHFEISINEDVSDASVIDEMPSLVVDPSTRGK